MRDRRHWPDCYINHGPIDATCDMGPECGTVTPETLTQEMIESLHPSAYCYGPFECTLEEQLDCYRADGSPQTDPEIRAAARQRICDALNARSTP